MTKALLSRHDSYKVVMSSLHNRHGEQFQDGRYVGTAPSVAAKKAAKQMFARARKDPHEYGHSAGHHTIVFKLARVTRNSEHKTFIYVAKELPRTNKVVRIETRRGSFDVAATSSVEVHPSDESTLLEAIRHAHARVRAK
jgi:hypothetical protein